MSQSAGRRTPKAQATLGALPEGAALQRERRDTRRPTQQPSRFCQSLPQSGPDFCTMTHRLRSLRESPTRSWAGSGGPRFHFVASRLRLPQRALGHSSAARTAHAIQLDAVRRIYNWLGARNAAKVDLKSLRKYVAALTDEIALVNQWIARQSTDIAIMQATRKRRRNVKVAL